MNLNPGLPGKSFEGGIELFSETNELELIRHWLPEAPDTVRIARVVHRVEDAADIFTVCCDFAPAKTVATREDTCRVWRLWEKHIALFYLPTRTWVGPREIQLKWSPKELEARGRDELSTAERVERDFQFEAQSAMCIWKLLHGVEVESFRDYYGGFAESFTNMVDLSLPPYSTKGFQFTQTSLELTILDEPDAWFYVLTRALNMALASPLLPEFALARLRLQQSGKLPDLSSLDEDWDHEDANAEVELRTLEERDATSTMFSLTVRLLDELLAPRLQQVNELIRLTEQAEPEEEEEDDDDHPFDFQTDLPDPD